MTTSYATWCALARLGLMLREGVLGNDYGDACKILGMNYYQTSRL